jgi:hypothetical protein
MVMVMGWAAQVMVMGWAAQVMVMGWAVAANMKTDNAYCRS